MYYLSFQGQLYYMILILIVDCLPLQTLVRLTYLTQNRYIVQDVESNLQQIDFVLQTVDNHLNKS